MSAEGPGGPPDERRTGYGEAEEGWEPPPREGPAEGRPTEDAGADAGRAPPPRGSTRPEPGPRCELCGGPVEERHCKIVCLNCGYQRDCSDP